MGKLFGCGGLCALVLVLMLAFLSIMLVSTNEACFNPSFVQEPGRGAACEWECVVTKRNGFETCSWCTASGMYDKVCSPGMLKRDGADCSKLTDCAACTQVRNSSTATLNVAENCSAARTENGLTYKSLVIILGTTMALAILACLVGVCSVTHWVQRVVFEAEEKDQVLPGHFARRKGTRGWAASDSYVDDPTAPLLYEDQLEPQSPPLQFRPSRASSVPTDKPGRERGRERERDVYSKRTAQDPEAFVHSTFEKWGYE